MRKSILFSALLFFIKVSTEGNFSSFCDSDDLHHRCKCATDPVDNGNIIWHCVTYLLTIVHNRKVGIKCYENFTTFLELSEIKFELGAFGDVSDFIIQHCPTTNSSMSALMAILGIQKINNLWFKSHKTSTLQYQFLKNLTFVKSVTLTNFFLGSIHRDLFADLINVSNLNLSNDSISDIPTQSFSNSTKLETLYLAHNNLTFLKPRVFQGLTRLTVLDLNSNKLINLSKEVFVDVPKLLKLNISSNAISVLGPDVFADLRDLTELDISGNKLISKNLPTDLLSHNTKLKTLRMDDNKQFAGLPSGFLVNLTELESLSVINCGLHIISDSAFYRPNSINKLYLRCNSLCELPKNLFRDFSKLKELDLSGNKFTNLSDDFLYLNNLISLELRSNKLLKAPGHIETGNMQYLKHLGLAFNYIREFKPLFFQNLISLDLSGNQLTSFDGLSPCESLKTLNLANNFLTEISWSQMNCAELKELDLSSNYITSVEIPLLSSFNKNAKIDLSNNKIREVIDNGDETNIYELLHEGVNLTNNPFTCDCKLLSFVQYIQTKRTSKFINYKCKEPVSFSDKSLADVPLEQLLCGIRNNHDSYVCPEKCKCVYRSVDRSNVISCTLNGTLPQKLPLCTKANQTELNLQGSHLMTFELSNNQNYDNVTYYNISNTSLADFNTTGISKQLKVLDISHNHLTMLNEEAVEFLNGAEQLRFLALHNNPWECGCNAKPLVELITKNTSPFTHHLRNISCSDGRIMQDLDVNALCINMAYVMVAIAVLLLSLLLILTVLYSCYKTQILIFCYSSNWKVLRWLVSHAEMDDDKEYDAFISFSHQDEVFVVGELIPFLEDRGFKLCLHYRDWIAGEFISHQIINAVHNSRRTVVVLSPNYLDSVWGLAEFKEAHALAIKDRNPRIVLILYADVGKTENLDDDLKNYLKMNTYLKYGSPWFWKQLFYALPHSDVKFGLSRSSRQYSYRRRAKNNEKDLQLDCDRGEFFLETLSSESKYQSNNVENKAFKDSTTPTEQKCKYIL